MSNRKNRLKKGIASLEIQKKIHLLKRRDAKEAGEEHLVEYYNKEIDKFEKEIEKKEDKL